MPAFTISDDYLDHVVSTPSPRKEQIFADVLMPISKDGSGFTVLVDSGNNIYKYYRNIKDDCFHTWISLMAANKKFEKIDIIEKINFKSKKRNVFIETAHNALEKLLIVRSKQNFITYRSIINKCCIFLIDYDEIKRMTNATIENNTTILSPTSSVIAVNGSSIKGEKKEND